MGKRNWDDWLIMQANYGTDEDSQKLQRFLQAIITDKKKARLPIEVEKELNHIKESSFFISAFDQPALRAYYASKGKMLDFYLSELMLRLQNMDWIQALQTCPGCKKLILSDAEYKNRWCSSQCRKRIWARQNRAKLKNLR